MNGYRFTSADERHIVQFRSDGFTFSQLAPYTRWDDFYSEARRLLMQYLSIAQPQTISRLALRYINQILIPSSEFEAHGAGVRLEEFLTTRPEVSDDMPGLISGFFLTLDIPLPRLDVTARIIETVLGDASDSLKLVLDIDVYRKVALSGTTDPATLDNVYSSLRNAKNYVFEASLTDRSRGLFQ
jgi:uncharacterized protein (TIGR04255 family)